MQMNGTTGIAVVLRMKTSNCGLTRMWAQLVLQLALGQACGFGPGLLTATPRPPYPVHGRLHERQTTNASRSLHAAEPGPETCRGSLVRGGPDAGKRGDGEDVVRIAVTDYVSRVSLD